jgi:hypothetical protein
VEGRLDHALIIQGSSTEMVASHSAGIIHSRRSRWETNVSKRRLNIDTYNYVFLVDSCGSEPWDTHGAHMS